MEQKRRLVACFFSTAPLEQLEKEQYSLSDIRILKEIGFEVIIANKFKDIPFFCDIYFSWWASGSFYPMIIAKISGKPNIVIAGGNEAMLYRDSITNKPAGYLAASLYKRIATRITLRFSTIVSVVSNYMISDVKKLSKRDVLVIPNCIDTEIFSPNQKKNKEYITTCFRIDENTTTLKRGENFIRAAQLVLDRKPQQKFVIIGHKGNFYSRIANLVKQLEIEDSIIFTGLINNKDVISWLNCSKCFVQISDTETFGVAIAEAMSCEVPVVISCKGAIPEIVNDCGIFVDHNSPQSIADGIIKILSLNKIEYQYIAERCRKRILENYTYENRKKGITNVIKPLLKSRDLKNELQ